MIRGREVTYVHKGTEKKALPPWRKKKNQQRSEHLLSAGNSLQIVLNIHSWQYIAVVSAHIIITHSRQLKGRGVPESRKANRPGNHTPDQEDGAQTCLVGTKCVLVASEQGYVPCTSGAGNHKSSGLTTNKNSAALVNVQRCAQRRPVISFVGPQLM
jgi:hypothetical protein